MKKQISFILVLMVLAINTTFAQHDHSDHAMSMKSSDEPETFEVDENFQNELAQVIVANFELTDAFANDDTEAIKQGVNNVYEKLQKVDMSTLTGQAHMKWMNSVGTLRSDLIEMAGLSDIEKQRTYFASFNEKLFDAAKSYGINGQKAYYQFCPMAFNNQGAHWLNDSEEIQNPYLGKKMPKCGSTKEVLN